LLDKPQNVTATSEMKYTSQHCRDKAIHNTIALYRECCFPNCTKSKVTFVGFRAGDHPPGSAPAR